MNDIDKARQFMEKVNHALIFMDRFIKQLDRSKKHEGKYIKYIKKPIDITFKNYQQRRQDIKDVFGMMNIFMEILSSDGKAIYKSLKEPIDMAYKNYQQMSLGIKDVFDKFEKELKLREENYRRIGIYAYSKQRRGPEKLMEIEFTEEQINEVALNDEEMRMYNFMRQVFDELYPLMNKIFISEKNRILLKTENYFPVQIYSDYEHPLQLFEIIDNNFKIERMMATPFLTPEMKKIFLETGLTHLLNLDAREIFLEVMDDFVYFINLAGHIERLRRVVEDSRFNQSVGSSAQEVLLKWIYLLGRKSRFVNWQRKRWKFGILYFLLVCLSDFKAILTYKLFKKNKNRKLQELLEKQL